MEKEQLSFITENNGSLTNKRKDCESAQMQHHMPIEKLELT